MSKREKLRRKLRNNPKGVTKQDMVTLLTAFSFVLDRVSGSHHIFIYRTDDTVQRLVIPIHGNEIKPKYVPWALEVLDEVFPTESDKDLGEDNELQDS